MSDLPLSNPQYAGESPPEAVAPHPFAQLVERVIATFIQAFAAYFMTAGALDATVAQAAILAGVAAAGTTLAGNLPLIPGGLPFWTDLLLRTGRTYAVSFLTLFFGASFFELSYSAATAAAVSAIPAALAVLKAGVGPKIGNENTTAWLPASLDPTPRAFALAA